MGGSACYYILWEPKLEVSALLVVEGFAASNPVPEPCLDDEADVVKKVMTVMLQIKTCNACLSPDWPSLKEAPAESDLISS